MKRSRSVIACLVAVLLFLLNPLGCKPTKSQSDESSSTAKTAAVKSEALEESPVLKTEIPEEPVPKGTPKIEVSELEFDAGDVQRGEDVVHVFVIKNVGTDVLNIKRAKGT